MNNSLTIPPKSNFSQPPTSHSLFLLQSFPFLLFYFSYSSRSTFLNTFSHITFQFPVNQETHSKFLKMGIDRQFLCQHCPSLFFPLYTQCSDKSLTLSLSDPMSTLCYPLMLLSCKQHHVLGSHFLLKAFLCFRICFECTSLYIFSCLGCNLPDSWSHVSSA